MGQAQKPRMVKVVFPAALEVGEPNQMGGIAPVGMSGDASHSTAGGKVRAALTHVVAEVDADKIARQMLDLAQRMRPAFDACAKELQKIKVSEISVGCAITAEAGLVFAGVGVEASFEITFDLS